MSRRVLFLTCGLLNYCIIDICCFICLLGGAENFLNKVLYRKQIIIDSSSWCEWKKCCYHSHDENLIFLFGFYSFDLHHFSQTSLCLMFPWRFIVIINVVYSIFRTEIKPALDLKFIITVETANPWPPRWCVFKTNLYFMDRDLCVSGFNIPLRWTWHIQSIQIKESRHFSASLNVCSWSLNSVA